MRRSLFLAFMFVFFLGISVAEEPLAQAAVEAHLLRITGPVQVERDDKTLQAESKMDILGGDVIVTGKKGEAMVDMGNGHIVTVKQNSQFQVDEHGPENDGGSAMLHYGTVYVKRAAGGTGQPIQVQTPSAVAGVRGTSFAVAVALDGSTLFGVEEGEVDVETDDGGKAKLGIMQQATIEADGGKKVQVEQYSPDIHPLEEWQQQRLDIAMKNPLVAIKKLTRNMANVLARGERFLESANKQAIELMQWVREADRYNRMGQSVEFSTLKREIQVRMAQFIPAVRGLVRTDNKLIAKRRLLKAMLEEAIEEGSAAPPRQVKIIKDNIDKIRGIEARAKQLHRGRVQFMRNRIPEIRQAAAVFK